VSLGPTKSPMQRVPVISRGKTVQACC